MGITLSTICFGRDPDDSGRPQGLCTTVTNAEELLKALAEKKSVEVDSEVVKEGLGLCSDWRERLQRAISGDMSPRS